MTNLKRLQARAEKRRAREQRKKRRLYSYLDQSVWEVVKDKPLMLKSPFTNEIRRPQPATFARDYKLITGPGRVK